MTQAPPDRWVRKQKLSFQQATGSADGQAEKEKEASRGDIVREGSIGNPRGIEHGMWEHPWGGGCRPFGRKPGSISSDSN